MNEFKRSDRVSNLIHRALSDIIENDLRDSRIGMATVTGVKLEKDLKNARVYISVLGDDNAIELSIDTLNNASGFIKARLSKKVDLKNTPAIKFFYDSSMVDGMQIDKLLNKVNRKA